MVTWAMVSIEEIQRLLRGQKDEVMSGLDERLGALKASLKEDLKADLGQFIEAKFQRTRQPTQETPQSRRRGPGRHSDERRR